MSTSFDPVRAQRDIVQRSLDAHAKFYAHARSCEQRLHALEKEHNDALLMERCCQEIIEQERRKLRELEERSETGGA